MKVQLYRLVKAGPFIGPRGGKWADAAHTIPWSEKKPITLSTQIRAEEALDAIHEDLSDWVHRNDGNAKRRMLEAHRELPDEQKAALQQVVSQAIKDKHGSGTVRMYRRMKEGQTPEAMGGMSLTTVKPSAPSVAFDVDAADVFLHWGVEGTPLASKAFGHEAEVILHEHARPALVSGEHTVKTHPKLGMHPELSIDVKKIEGDTAHVSINQTEIAMPKGAVNQLVTDLQGKVRAKPSGNPAIDAVTSGSASFLGKGDDGLAFKVGEQVVKVSTTTPYQPFNASYRTPERAVEQAREQHAAVNEMREAGVPGLLPEKFVEHDGRGYTIKPHVEIPEKLTKEQLKEATAIVHAMHAKGWTLGDEVQVGTHNGKVVLFDVGKASKGGSKRNDEEALQALHQKHGQSYSIAGKPVGERWAELTTPTALRAAAKIPPMRKVVERKLRETHAQVLEQAKDDLDREIANEELADALRILGKAQLYRLVKAGPYIGPRGGKWADPKHTIPWEGQHKKVLFHSAPAHSIESIQEHGLKPRKGAGLFSHGAYGAHSQGKVFLSDNFDAAQDWHGKVEDQLFDQHDDESKHDAVMLRVKHRRTKRDPVGDEDVSGSRFVERTIPPEHIEYHDKEHGWRPLDQWGEGKHSVPEDEDAAHHSGTESKRIKERADKSERERAESWQKFDAEQKAKQKALHDKWSGASVAEREAEAKRLLTAKTMIPGFNLLTPQMREALRVDEKGKALGKAQLYRLVKGAALPSGHVPDKTRKTGGRKLHKRLKWNGLDISIENRKGSYREWYDPNAKEQGRTRMLCDYGYVRGSIGADGDHVDCYIGPDESAPNVYVVNQLKRPEFKSFDEQKCMLGFASAAEAKRAYLAHFNDPRFFGSMKAMPVEEFKRKVLDTSTKKPIVKSYRIVKAGPYIGPKGGKYADPDHKVPWKETQLSSAQHRVLGSVINEWAAEARKAKAKGESAPKVTVVDDRKTVVALEKKGLVKLTRVELQESVSTHGPYGRQVTGSRVQRSTTIQAAPTKKGIRVWQARSEK